MADDDFLSPGWLLVKTCQDLALRSKSTTLYDKMRMAGLLHQLLVGPRSLVAQVNADPVMPLELWYREPREKDAERWEGLGGFDAAKRRTAVGEVKKTDLGPFLEARVVHAERWFSVEELLASVSHFYGGAYERSPAEAEREALLELDRMARLGPAGPVGVALHEIAQVALRALIPLAREKADLTTRQKSGTGERPAAPIAPAGSGCPFGGKLPAS